MLKLLRKIDTVVGRVLRWGAMGCMALLMLVLLTNVAVRLLRVGTMMSWYTEVVEILFAWMVMLGAASLSRTMEHFRVDLLKIKFAQKRGFYIFDAIAYAIALVFYIYLLVYGVRLAQCATQPMPVLGICKGYGYLCIPVGALFLCLYTVRDIVLALGRFVGKLPLPVKGQA